MFAYQTPISSLNRLLSNDKSTDFKIILEIKYSREQNGILIQQQKRIIFKTTINKARVVSKIINEHYTHDQTLNEYIFSVSKLNQIKITDIIDVVSTLIQKDGYELIQEEKRNLYEQIVAIFDTDKDTIEEYKIIECQYNEDNKFDGIISYILKKSNGNDKDLKLTSGCRNYFGAQYDISNLLLMDVCYMDKGFMSCVYDRNSAWIEYDFGKRKINMTSYTIRSLSRFYYQCQPKTWKFIGSNDHEKWEMIDFKKDNDVLNKGYCIGHFECVRTGKFYRYIRYVQIRNWNQYETYKQCHNYRYIISLSSIEFFGSISFS